MIVKKPIAIRKADSTDLPAMKQLFSETITAVCKNDYTEEQSRAWASGADNSSLWNKIITEQYVLVAENSKTLTGFCSIDSTGHIDLLYVHKDYQRQGIAGSLYAAIEKYAVSRGIKQVTADVSITAKPFFEKAGFTFFEKQTAKRKGTGLINYKAQKKLFNFLRCQLKINFNTAQCY